MTENTSTSSKTGGSMFERNVRTSASPDISAQRDLARTKDLIDLLALADVDSPPEQLVESVLGVIDRFIGPHLAFGLVVERWDHSLIEAFAAPAKPLSFAEVLRRYCPGTHSTFLVDHGRVRVVSSDALIERLEQPFPAHQLIVVADEIEGRLVCVAMSCAEEPNHHFALSADSLRTLAGALFSRRQLAHQRRQRIERIATLSEVLSDVASHLDVNVVLQTIVERARDLVKTDAAYLAEIDESGRTIAMRVTVGISDDGYKQGKVEIGKGMAGAVAATGRAMQTHDYVNDSTFVHTSDTDENVRREGIRGVIMAPLRIGDRTLGVLGVANHRATVFSSDDVQLITSLADGAVIALENAKLYSTQSSLVVELRELHEVSERQHEELKRSVYIHDQLTDHVLQGHGIQVVADRLSTLIGNPVVVLGKYFNLLAFAKIERADAVDVAGKLRSATTSPSMGNAFARLRDERQAIHMTPGTFGEVSQSMVIMPVLVGADLLGFCVAIEAVEEFESLDLRALEQASTVFALELTRSRVVAEVENRLRADLVNDILHAAFDEATLVERSARLGHDLSVPQLVVLVSLDPEPTADSAGDLQAPMVSDQHLERALRAGLLRHGLMAQTSIIGDQVAILVAVSPIGVRGDLTALEKIGRIHEWLARHISPHTVSIGVSALQSQPGNLPKSFREAREAIRTAHRLSKRNGLILFERLGVDRLLSEISDSEYLGELVDSLLGSITAYDSRHGAKLIETLATYLDAGCNQRATADLLGIHVNTLQYRLSRIEDLGKFDLGDPESRFSLQLALRASQLVSH